MVAAYRQAGRDPAAALRQARITPAQLRRSDARIDALQMEQVSAAAMQELDDEALGWFSRRLPWGSYGMLCRASISAPDLGVALKRWCRHHRLLVEDVLLSLRVEGGTATLSIDEQARLGGFRELCLVTLLRSVHGFACWAVDSRIPLREVAFPFAAPPHHDAYPLMFPGPIRFSAPRAALVFDAAYLALPLRRDERALRTMLQRALPLTVRPYRRDRLLAQRVRELLRGGAGTAAALAEALHVSVRTLHRQLRDEGSTLQALKDEVRRDTAIALLARSQRPVKQVAAAAGFRNPKSFARAFRQWTGMSPEQWRRGAQAP
jgi:AraC-like DNA-binding protein